MEFVIFGKTEKSKDELKREIQRMGGKVGTKIHQKLAAIISTEEELKRMGGRMTEAKDFGIQVVPEDFLDDAKGGGAISFIISKSLCDWGTDVSRGYMQLKKRSITSRIFLGLQLVFFSCFSHGLVYHKMNSSPSRALFTPNRFQSRKN